MLEYINEIRQVPRELDGLRLDQAAALLFSEYSRERLKQWIQAGDLTVDNQVAKPKQKVIFQQQLYLRTQLKPKGQWLAQAHLLDIRYEDDDLLIVNKPAGLVVHPAAGNPDHTLLNALLAYRAEQRQLDRAGIVHRLDKDTTGLLVVAKTLATQRALIDQLKAHEITRIYDAFVNGMPISSGTIVAPIGRHHQDRKRQAVVSHGKEAITHYRIEERFRVHCWLKCQLETGRTHQIRVHLAHHHWPIIGDRQYGGRLKLPVKGSDQLRTILQNFPRQALHARQLQLIHPISRNKLIIEAPLPDDMQQLLFALRDDQKQFIAMQNKES